jgi:cysteine-S-conjugate beta-lyase
LERSFDEVVDMTGTGSMKWEMVRKFFKAEEATPMWVADMDFRGPAAVIEALKQRAELGIYGYTGHPDFLYEAVSAWISRRHGWKVEREWICYSPGVIAALNACVKCFTEPGERVIIQPPVYAPFFKAVEDNGRELIQNPLKLVDGKYVMDFDDLREKAKSSGAKMLILCSPHNPIGRVWTAEELAQLAQICIEHDLLVVSDEIHADLVYQPRKHIPLPTVAPELASRTIVCMAPSKTFNMAGLAASFIMIPDKRLRESFKQHLERAHLTMINPFAVIAADAAYRHGDEWLDRVLEYIKSNVEYMGEYLRERIPSLSLIAPEGTYLAWLDCRQLWLDDKALQEFMLKEAKVVLNAGIGFGKEGSGFMRINLAAPRAVLIEALGKMEAAVAALKGRG